MAQAVGFGCDNPLDSHDLTTIQCADCEQCVDTPSNAQYFPVNQKERAVMFQFPEGAESFDVTFSVTCTDCVCLLYTSPSPRDATLSRMPSSA